MESGSLSKLTEFDWDEGNKSKIIKRMPLEIAESAFMGEPLVFYDQRHSQHETRWFLMNEVGDQAVAIIFTVRKHRIRIISARYMHKREVKKYGKKIKT